MNKDIYILQWEEIDNLDIKKICGSKKKYGKYIFPTTFRAYTNINNRYEYVKIAEGCNCDCSFCIIPQIKGKQQSRTIQHIVNEINDLVDNGVYEIILLAQDTSRYGVDIYGKPYLCELLKEIDKIDKDFVYRVLYLYPDIISLKYIQKLSQLDKFIPYFDIPLQHVSKNVLKNMNRFYDIGHINNIMDSIDKYFKHNYKRTNFIVGFPGETKNDFQQLVDFIKQQKFDNISLFEYHDEKYSKSYHLKNKLDNKTIVSRRQKLDSCIKRSIIKDGVGFVEQINKDKLLVRPLLHAPEVDPVVEIDLDKIELVYENTDLNIGNLVYFQDY